MARFSRGVALLAFGAAVAYLSSCAKRNAGVAMLKENKEELIGAFRGEYGRICTLVAQALTRGHQQPAVVESASGRGNAVAPVYVGLRKQRKRVNERLAVCKAAGITDQEIVDAAREIRKAVEAEWQRHIPMMA